MNELAINENIENMIYKVRGVEVMLDSDLAKIYNCANGTKSINLAVKRNLERFPDDFYFQLKEEEFSQISGFSLKPQKNKIRSMPYVFTEQGVAMLATVIKTDVATVASINIMRAFVKMKNYINFNEEALPNRVLLLEKRVDENTNKINELFNKFDPLVITKGYIIDNGEFFEAYSRLIEILDKAFNEIIIIDNYADKELLNILKKYKKRIIVVSKNIDELLIKKYKKQYNNIIFIHNESFHDRFIIIDKTLLYTCGASFKDLGKKCSYIGEISSDFINIILDAINYKDIK